MRWIGGLAARVAPGFMSRTAARLFAYPHGPRRRPAREERWLSDAVPFELDANGHTLAAWSWGDGPTVLLHHGWNGRGGQLGAFVAPLVDAGYSVVTYDAPAHGDSPGRYTNGVDMARTLAAAAHRLNGLHAVVAHSLGCVATGYALRTRLPVDRVVFIAPPADMIPYTQAFVDALGLSDEVRDDMLRYYERTLGFVWDDFNTECFARADRRIRGRQTPALIIHDHSDKEAPASNGLRVHAAWEDSDLHLTEGLGHRRILRDPAVVAKVLDYVATRRSRTAACAG